MTTRLQYTQGERGDITEMTVVINSVPLEENSPDRLKLADVVLNCALTLLEFEIKLDLEKEKREKIDVADLRTPKGTGGYN